MADSFIESLWQLSPWLSTGAKNELAALEELFTVFPGKPIKEVVKELKKYRKTQLLSGGVMAERARALRANEGFDGGPAEDEQTLVGAFAAMKAAEIQKLAKALGITLIDKNDQEYFRQWLRTGAIPPTAEERVRLEAEEYTARGLAVLNRTLDELSQDSIDELMAIADQVGKKLKITGLALFTEGLGFPAVKKSVPAVKKQLRQDLDNLALARFKGVQIRGTLGQSEGGTSYTK